MRRPRAPAWDYLNVDGGWLTAEGIAMEIEMCADNVYRSLYRWQRRGYVESRRIELAFIGGVNHSGRNISGHMEARREWRTT